MARAWSLGQSLTIKPGDELHVHAYDDCLRGWPPQMRPPGWETGTAGVSRTAGGLSVDETDVSIFRLPVRAGSAGLHRVGGSDFRPVVPFFQGLAGLFPAPGLRAAGDDPGARRRR